MSVNDVLRSAGEAPRGRKCGIGSARAELTRPINFDRMAHMMNEGQSLQARLRRHTLARRIRCCNSIAALRRARPVHVTVILSTCVALLLSRATESVAGTPGLNHDWVSIHGDLANNRYVPLAQINPKTIDKLGAVWVSEPFADGATSRMTPIVRDRLMFFAAGAGVYALDARSGRVVWVHKSESRKPVNQQGLSDPVSAQASGLAISRSWGLGLGDGLVFAGLVNGHVIALDEKTGEVAWDELVSEDPLPIARGVTCPPLYVNGVLYFGLGIEHSRGQVIAVDARSGRVLWRTPTIPAPGEPGHETWPSRSEIWRSGGGTPWTAAAADPSLGLVYFVTGNPGPATGGKLRPGDNLYSASLIALQMNTGQLRWYRQLVHHDIWESDLSVSPVLFDTKTGGRVRKAVAVMRGDGYLFAYDRSTGEALTPIEERSVPQNPLLFTAPTQPFPRGAESILPPCDSWKNKVPAGFLLGCIYDPPSHDVPNRLAQYASVRIAPMSFSPRTGYFYAQGTDSLMQLGTADDPYVFDITGGGYRVPNFPQPTVVVAAVDSRTGKVVWKKELPSYDDSGLKSNGGALSTAGGLVFHQGGDGTLQAYSAATGETLWRFQTDFAVGDASPMSYAVDGKQYVAFIAGSKVWAFTLVGKVPQAAPIPPPLREDVKGPIEDTNEIETLTLEQLPENGRRYRLNEYAFNPYRARVRAGSSVTFINNGYLPHTIVGQDGSWTTGTLGPTQVKTVTFEKAGSYLYSSKEYPWSYGQIIVSPAVNGSSAGAGSQQDQSASEQVNLGKAAYTVSCAICHGENLAGRDAAPPLSGGSFAARWAGRDSLALFDRIRMTMPPTAHGSLSDATYAAIVAYIRSANDDSALVPLDQQSMKNLTVTPK
jgi:quinohemoprotein ethanol dehydrogenase